MVERAEGALVGGEAESTPAARSRPKLRLLALDVRPQKFGFVVFEGPTRLLDYGVRNFACQQNQLRTAVTKKISSILNLHAPTIVVMHQRPDGSSLAKKIRGLVTRTIRAETRRRSIEVQMLSTRAVRRFFVEYECETKHQIASVLAEWFEDLAWKLPPKRRPWEGEHHNSVIFEAVAVGVTFFAQT